MCKACEMEDLPARSCHANDRQPGYTGKQEKQEKQEKLEKTVRKGAVTDFDSAATRRRRCRCFGKLGPGRDAALCSLLFTDPGIPEERLAFPY